MSRKTRRAIKKSQIFFFFFLLVGHQLFAVTPAQELATADSLYTSQKYTESFDIYEKLYTQDGLSSPAALLKMAYIKEGLGDYSNALFYLSAYFDQTLDKKALVKIDELVKANELSGYGNQNNTYVRAVILKFVKYFLGGILLLFSLLLLWAVRRTAKGKNPAFLIVMMVLILPFLFALNFDYRGSSAIVMDETTYLMDGPSGSANVMETISKGHKLAIKATDGLWSQVRWDNKVYYVRKSKLKEII